MGNSLKKTIATNIKNKRKSLGLKQEFVAKELGVLDNSISRMESGAFFISIQKLQKVCKILKCSSSDILGF